MADIEKVIQAMEECIKYDYVCYKCPYKPSDDESDCSNDLMADALELLKQQREKIHKLETALFTGNDDALWDDEGD